MPSFEPHVQAARAQLALVRPQDYAQTRNALDGAVTRLSPYITHGLLSLREVYDDVHARFGLDARHKLVFELGWRAYYRHVWSHLGEGIHQSIHAGVLPDEAYRADMPLDVVQARTGVAAIDLAVSELYASGYLHNHARMWLASYLVHLRKVHWRVGAQWMLAHLLDGDVASNHLSWQWVAGTGSTKPYLFNAENVAKFAPAQWRSPGTVIDTSYEALDELARSPRAAVDGRVQARVPSALMQPPWMSTPPDERWSAPDARWAAGRDVVLLHPWSLGAAPHVTHAEAANPQVLLIGAGFEESHAPMAWSERRWRFVTEGMLLRTPNLWWGSAQKIAQALQGARSVSWLPEPHVDQALQQVRAHLQAKQPQPTGQASPTLHTLSEPVLFEPVETYCSSFAKWWRLSRIAA